MNMQPIDAVSWQEPMLAVLILVATSCSAGATTFDAHDPKSPLRLTRTIVLPAVHGRIDHMALDPRSNHLFVAELGNGSVDDVDLTSGTVAGRIFGLDEPQGVAWLPAQREIAVACGDGSVRFFRESDRHEVARVSLGRDADNVRVDARNGNLLVGYGSGGLATIDPGSHRLVGELKLPAHPEGFAIVGSRVLVNVPQSREVIIADLGAERIIKALSTGASFGNYPMAWDGRSYVAVGFRFPGTISVLDVEDGSTKFVNSVCGDADDLYFLGDRIVVVCGEGAVALVDEASKGSSVRVTTDRGARTGLLDSDHNRLFVAVPAGPGPAAIWELSFQPQKISQSQ